MKNIIIILIFISLHSCGIDDKNLEKGSKSIEKESKIEKIEEIKVIKEYWEYSESEDKMSGEIKKFAVNTSTNKLNFEFPYDGGSTATITLRKNGKSIDAILRISKGQFNISYNGGSIRIKFDKNKPETYKYLTTSDGSQDVIFIEPTKKFIKQIEKSNNLIIETEFFNEGIRQLEFTVSNLKWE